MATRWRDLSDRERKALLTLGCVQLSLAATAWTDLARRPADEVNGPKPKWAAIIAINFIGPILYFTKARKRTP